MDCADFGSEPSVSWTRLGRGSEGTTPPTHWPEPYGSEPSEPIERPVWGEYSHSRSDPRAVSEEDARAFAKHLREVTGRPTRILSHPSQLEVGSRTNQVLVNLRFAHSLVTAVIGPGWDPSIDRPILVVSGNPGTTSNNASVLGLGWPTQLVGYPGLAAQEGASLVTLISNVGGAESQGQHPNVMADVACAIEWAGQNLNADTANVVFTGKSRGGGTALAWGANPFGYDYGVAGVFAHTPPWDHAHLVASPVELFPEIVFEAAGLVGMPDAVYWSNDPTPDDLRARFFEVHGPDGTVEGVAAHTHRAHRQGLRDVGRVVVGLGTHDQQVLYSDGVQLMADFEDLGLDAHIEIGVRAGHWDQPGVWEAFDALLRELAGIESIAFEPGTTQRWHPRVGEEGEAELVPADMRPWVGLVPVLVERGGPSAAVVCGPGGRLEVQGGLSFNEEVAPGCIQLDFVWGDVGTIEWRFVVDGQEVTADDTIHGRALQTTVTSERLEMEAYIADLQDTRTMGFVR